MSKDQDVQGRANAKFKKAETFQVAVCNFAGTPTAHVKLTYK